MKKKDEELEICLKDNYYFERKLNNEGYKFICGVDEVGRGPLVGPVVACAVILPVNFELPGLTDSKKLSEKKRNMFADIIKKEALAYSIISVSNDIIDEVNIYEATKIAMKKAIKALKIKPALGPSRPGVFFCSLL